MLPQSAHPLPDSWTRPELFQDCIVADGLEVHRVGIAVCAPTGEEITASAVETHAPPVARGYFELLERVAILETIAADGALLRRDRSGTVTGTERVTNLFPASPEPDRWRFARSNGVAIHDSWPAACERAYLELVERDRVLRAWHGETRPEPLSVAVAASFDQLRSYDLSAHAFPCGGGEWGSEVEVVGVFGFPRRERLPLLLGYGARHDRGEALAAATREMLQALGFLWGEELPSDPPTLGPTPASHVEAMLYPPRHRLIRDWLERGHQRFADRPAVIAAAETAFYDLTPPWLNGLRVAKAASSAAVPLAFGDSPFVQHLPTDLRAHPIP